MNFSDLEPVFLKRIDDKRFRHVDSIEDADGVRFLCPKCFEKNSGPIGTHGVICWSPDVPQTTEPTPGRWQMKGTGFADLTLVAGSSSIQINGDCNAHFFVENGKVKDA
ncbi:MAG: hypothetical protein KDJ69_10040 [Nitratireductor sp.]|nr:hypothetical protein [Nitratireductor sp.]